MVDDNNALQDGDLQSSAYKDTLKEWGGREPTTGLDRIALLFIVASGAIFAIGEYVRFEIYYMANDIALYVLGAGLILFFWFRLRRWRFQRAVKRHAKTLLDNQTINYGSIQ